jgi:galactokinase
VEAYAAQFDEMRSRAIAAPREGNWLDYVVGCLKVLAEEGHPVPALRVAIDGSVPMGAGISSSAALEIALLRAARSLLGLPIDDTLLALLGQRAENGYVGMQCGTMDQMVASLGAPGKALFLDTRDNRTALIDLPAGHRIAVVHCGVPHRLTASGYNTRREECNRAARALGVALLREVGMADMARIEALAPPLDRRARHVVSENARVLAGVDALRRGQTAVFGRLMDESHASQRDDYEVSIPEIDALVESARRHGAVGARLTGGGFGGSIVALVPEDAFDPWLAGVLADRPAARLL